MEGVESRWIANILDKTRKKAVDRSVFILSRWVPCLSNFTLGN